MTIAHRRFKGGTAQWTPEGESPVTLTGVRMIRFGEGAQAVELIADGNEIVEEECLHSLKGRISVTILNQDHMAELPLGLGAFQFDMEKVKSGRGAVAGADKRVTFGKCNLVDKDSGAGSEAGEETTLQMSAVDNGAGALYTYADAT